MRVIWSVLGVVLATTGCFGKLDQLQSDVQLPRAHPAGLRIAVADLEVPEQEPYSDGASNFKPLETAGARMADTIATRLTGFAEYRMIERSRFDQVLKELELQRSDLVDPESLQRVGKLLGSDAIVVGRIEGWYWNNLLFFASSIKTAFRLVAVETGEALWSAEGYIVRKNSTEDLYTALADELFPKLRGRLDEVGTLADPE